MEMTGLKVGELDILDGSPPCPPFSMSGTKKKGWNKEKTAYGMKQKNIEHLSDKGKFEVKQRLNDNKKVEIYCRFVPS